MNTLFTTAVSQEPGKLIIANLSGIVTCQASVVQYKNRIVQICLQP